MKTTTAAQPRAARGHPWRHFHGGWVSCLVDPVIRLGALRTGGVEVLNEQDIIVLPEEIR